MSCIQSMESMAISETISSHCHWYPLVIDDKTCSAAKIPLSPVGSIQGRCPLNCVEKRDLQRSAEGIFHCHVPFPEGIWIYNDIYICVCILYIYIYISISICIYTFSMHLSRIQFYPSDLNVFALPVASPQETAPTDSRQTSFEWTWEAGTGP